MRRVLAGVLTLAVLVTSVPSASAQQLGTDRRLFVIGDSVMVGAQGAIVSALPGWQVTVEADVGLSLLGSISIVQQRRAEIGEVAVIELGANDTTDVGVFTQRVDSMMGALATVPRVIWINQPSFAAGRSALDGVLTAAATRYPNLDVIDWSAQVAAHPDYVGADGLHLSSAGAQALAGAVAGRLFAWVVQNTAPSVFAVVGPAVGTALTRFATVLSP